MTKQFEQLRLDAAVKDAMRDLTIAINRDDKAAIEKASTALGEAKRLQYEYMRKAVRLW